jgi:hypothetical protein
MTPSGDIVNALSRYLARHLSEDDLLVELRQLGTDGLRPDARELLAELEDELGAPKAKRGPVEVLVRETLQAIALDERGV